MGKCKIAILGRAISKDDLKHLAKIEKALTKKRTDIEVVCIRKDAEKLPTKCMVSWMDSLFNLTVHAIEKADMIIVIEPVARDMAGASLVSWVLGYAYALGVPVGILTDLSKHQVESSPIPIHSLHAHYISVDDLLAYDFEEKPFKPFKGMIL